MPRPVKFALIPLGILVLLVLFFVLQQAAATLARLDQVERERDQWQKSAEVLRELDLKNGDSVADLGSGAGYFTLKLSSLVGERGRVVAIDLRKISLAFLWVRSRLRHQGNVSVVVADLDDPRLPAKVDAVLIVNTFHELSYRDKILAHVRGALKQSGRLVIADRGTDEGPHKVPLTTAVNELRAAGFQILSEQDRFTEQPGEGTWWLITATPK